MPKEGLNKQEWESRLKLYAIGSFTFGKGQKPPKGSKIAKKIDAIERCPSHGIRDGQTTLFGAPPKCHCHYHPKKCTPKKVSFCQAYYVCRSKAIGSPALWLDIVVCSI